MLILLSPAKRLDFSPDTRDLPATKPALHAEAKRLAAHAKRLSPSEIKRLMGVSDTLAEGTHTYFQDWKAKWDPKGSKRAVLAFRGDVYLGLDADTLTDRQLAVAQDRLRILSGLYGLLRPLDLIQPYRLEMGRALKTDRGADLYAWWGDRLTRAVNDALRSAGEKQSSLVVNLASKEYWSAVDPTGFDARVVSPVFKDKNHGAYKVLGFFAKRARGLMARHLIKSRSPGERALLAFSEEGYRYNTGLSTPDAPVFTRESPPKK